LKEIFDKNFIQHTIYVASAMAQSEMETREIFDRALSAAIFMLFLIVGKEGLKLGGAKVCHKGGPRPSSAKTFGIKKSPRPHISAQLPAKKSTRHEVSTFSTNRNPFNPFLLAYSNTEHIKTKPRAETF